MPSPLAGATLSLAAESETIGSDGRPCLVRSDSPPAMTLEGEVSGSLVMSKREFLELLAASIRGSVFALTLTVPSTQGASPAVLAISRGVEELYELPRRHLLEESERLFFDPQVDKIDPDVEAALQSAYAHGSETMVVKTQRKASGDLFKVCQYSRGISFGVDPVTGADLWYLLSVSLDVTGEFERHRRAGRPMDHEFYQESAISIAAQAKACLSAAVSSRLSDAAMKLDEILCKSPNGEGEAGVVEALHIAAPSWVVSPATASEMLLAGF